MTRPTSPRLSPSSRPRAVVINDDPVQLRTMRATLEQDGWRVTPFQSAAGALRTLPGREGPVDLFVVDLHMPDVDGWKVCRMLRSPELPAFNAIPILVVSAIFTGSDVESITSELGASAFLEVPFRREELLSFARGLLEGRRPEMETVALVVEDDASVRSAVSRAFLSEGYRVLEAASVEEARSRIQEARIRVVVLDHHLPDGTAEAFLAEVSGALESRVTLVMTGDADPDLPLRLLERGIDAFVRKPFDPGLLVEMARRAARQRALLRVEAALESRTRELHESERRYRVLFETIPDTLLVLDHADGVATVNPAGARRLGPGSADLLGRPVAELAPPRAAMGLAAGIARLRTGYADGFETVLRDADGKPFDAEVRGRPLENGGGGGLLLMARDITERRRAEEERRRLEQRAQHGQRLESLGILAGGVAHDFNNLLVGVLGNAALARMDLPAGSPGLEFLEQIETAARSAAELTEQILTFAGKRKAGSQSLDLRELVGEVERVFRPVVSRTARIRCRLPRHLPGVKGDPGQLRQVVMNLVLNASDALAGASGDIDVGLEAVCLDGRSDPELVGGRRLPAGEYVSLRVADNGCGMSSDTVQRIFEPFFTTKDSGRGLGLAAVLGIVQAHGGGISVDSAPGRGTRITVLLAADGEEGRAPVPEPNGPAWTEGGRILVVDDEHSVRRLASRTLHRGGFEVVEAADGQEALDRLEEVGETLALVLLDVTMPEVDGLEVLARVRVSTPDLPVLLSSGYSVEMIPEAAPGEPTGFLPKPYVPDELLDAVSRLLRGHARPLVAVSPGMAAELDP